MVYSSDKVNVDLEMPEDQRSMMILCQIADTVDVNLKFEFDCPSLHPVEQAVPILDLQCWTDNDLIRHKFYKKQCAPERTVMAGTALSGSTLRNTIFQEGIRRLRAWDRHSTVE